MADTSTLRSMPGTSLGPSSRRMQAMLRYGVGICAPATVAVAQFVVQLVLLRHLNPGDFGVFALLMVMIQFGYGLSNALISTPFTVALHDRETPDAALRAFFGVNAAYAAGFGVVCALIGVVFSVGPWILVFGAYAALAMLRWFGRAHCYAVFRQMNAAASDVSYAVLLLGFVGSAWLLGRIDMLTVSLALLAATLGSLPVIRTGFLGQQFGRAAFSSLAPYGRIWQTQARWSLLGVVTTEATTNAHAYLVSGFAGAAAFAPLAAAALFTRPVALAITSLTQLERPALSKAIAAQDVGRARATCRSFFIVLLLIWLAVTIAACVILVAKPDLLAGKHYAPAELQLAFAFLALIALAQVFQTPASVFLQAAGEFRSLAMASALSSIASILLAAAALVAAGPVYSLLGIVAGKVMMAVQVLRRSRKWEADRG
ncbi:lipopolysaccharide biosynthesis protein [Aestuariivirga sp.]|uniref:lipopolysaccharide biosynthesis protein n=1 Tax=Aestuariivirga sp. TaxID=2650926 RepID=UPI0035B473E9